jgi:hypothetical protein
MTYPRVLRSEPKMNGRHRWSIRLSESIYYIEVVANQEEDAIQIAILTNKCSQLEKQVKELKAQLEEPDSDVEHNYSYAPT